MAILLLPSIELVLVSILAGLTSVIAVNHQRVFFAEAISHATFPGAVIGVAVGSHFASSQAHLSIWLFLGAAIMCVPMAWLMRYIATLSGQSAQAAAGIVLTVGFGLGFFLNRWLAPLPLHIESFLTGSLLAVSYIDIASAGAVLLFTLLVIVTQGSKLTFAAFDRRGFRTILGRRRLAFIDGAVLAIVTASIVVLIPAVGTILSIALIASPAAAIRPFVSSTKTLLLVAPLYALAASAVGLFLAIHYDLSIGGMISAIAAGAFMVSRIGLVIVGKLLPKDKPVSA